MMNKKLIALLVAVTTVSAVSAHRDNCYRGDDGYMRCNDARAVITEPAYVAGKTGEGLLKIGTLGAYETSGERERNRTKNWRERQYDRNRERDENIYSPAVERYDGE